MSRLRKPEWLKSQKLGAKKTRLLTKYLREYNLHTVCESARCPNRGECFERGTATFMILGEVCTRNCRFCAVEKGRLPANPDPKEPGAIAELCKKLKLKHVVITTVTRDDLPDGGAFQFVKVIEELRRVCGDGVTIEVLISDLQGNMEHVKQIIDAGPDVLNHNVETIPRLYEEVRPSADFERSLAILKEGKLHDPKILTKSGLMVGLGETEEEVISLLRELRNADVDIVTIGQYLAPSGDHYPVREYVHPDVFDRYRREGEDMGFKLIESGPLVRSSYHAEKARDILKKGD